MMIGGIIQRCGFKTTGYKTGQDGLCSRLSRSIYFCRNGLGMCNMSRRNELGTSEEKNTSDQETHANNKSSFTRMQSAVHFVPDLIRRVHFELIGFLFKLPFEFIII